MNNTTTDAANVLPKMNLVSALAEAKRLSGQYGLPSFVYQTGPSTFNYRFVSENSDCGVLVARFDKTGKSC